MTVDQIEEAVAVIASPCRHLETCVEWSDDSGKKWIGTGICYDPASLAAENARNPTANTLQRRIEAALAYCRARRQPARIIVLKGRRSGSSLICAKLVDLECRNKPTKALVMADVFKRSDEIFEMQRRFALSDVFPWGFGVTGTARTIEYGNGSKCVKETALDPNAGRGGGFRVLWFSECAHFPSDGVRDAKKLMLATLNTVPKTPDSIVIAESTANSCSGWFYDRWLKARWPDDDHYWRKWDTSQGQGDEDEVWIRVFAAWFEIPRNAMHQTDAEREEILAGLDAHETEGVARYGWTAEQIKWRRWTIRNDFAGDVVKFDQEYPPDPKTAFVASGSPAFSRDSLATLRAMAKHAEPEWKYGVLEAVGATTEEILAGRLRDVPIIFRQTPRDEAWVAVLESPTDGFSYMAACDPATGALMAEEGGGETDMISVLVGRAGYTETGSDGPTVSHRPRIVARLMWEVMEWHPTERQTLYLLALLCRYYGNCTLVIETNKGEWVIIGAKNAGLNLYRETIHSRIEEQVTTKLGFTTTEESRHSIITRLQSLVHGSQVERNGVKVWEPGIEIECPHIVEEMETFVRDKRGRFAAASGRHDDDVLSLAMLSYLIDGAARYRTRQRARRSGRMGY